MTLMKDSQEGQLEHVHLLIAIVSTVTVRIGSWSVTIYCMYNSSQDEHRRQHRFCFMADVWRLPSAVSSSKDCAQQARLCSDLANSCQSSYLGRTSGSIVWYYSMTRSYSLLF